MEQTACSGQGCLFSTYFELFPSEKKKEMLFGATYEVQYRRDEILRVLVL